MIWVLIGVGLVFLAVLIISLMVIASAPLIPFDGEEDE